jgi:alpha-galactosidase
MQKVLDKIKISKRTILLSDGQIAPEGVVLTCQQDSDCYHFAIENTTSQRYSIREVILFDVLHGLPGDTEFYGEGYTMLSQTAGTLAKPEDLSELTDRKHYRLSGSEGFHTVYGMMSLSDKQESIVLGFSSCRRFIGRFHVNTERLQISLLTEDLILDPGHRWELEELMILSGPDRSSMLSQLAQRIVTHHPRLPFPQVPTGWCSWYAYGTEITPELVISNMAALRANAPDVRYVQIDDGYQPWMGDWLEPSERFPQGLAGLLKQIREMGFEPAIWVAPFIASPNSKLFREHPDWFVMDEHSQPLSSDRVTFKGWRDGPWYMLDGTHPGAQKYLEKVFRTMREEWGCSYFKLDANAWGAMPFGRRYDAKASSIEAYRRGMAVIRQAAGDAFILGCNHPIWPSLGEIHGSRSSGDVNRDWTTVKQIARENLCRNWQNNQLWWNDPDCLLIDPEKFSPAEQLFHSSATIASGGMLLSGDAVMNYSRQQWNVFHRALSQKSKSAVFEDLSLTKGTIRCENETRVVLLNNSDKVQKQTTSLQERVRIIDFWTEEDYGVHEDTYQISLEPHAGRLLKLIP